MSIGMMWISTREAAKISGFHPDYVRQLARAGKVHSTHLGFAVAIEHQSLRDYLSSDRKRGPKPK